MGGDGVFILVRDDIDHVEDAFPDDNKGCESVWSNVDSSMQSY